jgi:hypothetical protein
LPGCSGSKKPPVTETTVSAGQPTKKSPVLSSMRRQVVEVALSEWAYFGKQTVKLSGGEESIPHVGKWEDDGGPYTSRVNSYWRSVGKPDLDGMDCKQPWSAAFISWVMESAGVPSIYFPRSEAHWNYLKEIMDNAGSEGSAFRPHRTVEYAPVPGDLVCATRGHNGLPPSPEMSPEAVLQEHTRLHCDIVVEQSGNQLGVVGGNVRNSVSKTLLTLNPDGTVQPTEQRPWFVVIENRL